MGAWIETNEIVEDEEEHFVAPCMGAWIETT